MNQNAGNKPIIPINTSRPPQAAPSAAIIDKISAQASAAAATATLTPAAARPHSHSLSQPLSHSSRKRRWEPAESRRLLRGIYFDPPVYNALHDMQARGVNVSSFVNNLVRQSLPV